MAKPLNYWKSILPPESYAELERKYKAQFDNRNTNTAADMEPSIEMAEKLPVEILKSKGFNKPVHITFHSIRGRMADNDNISEKVALDSIVKSGILPDDRPCWIPEKPRHIQEIGKEEKTIIYIEEV